MPARFDLRGRAKAILRLTAYLAIVSVGLGALGVRAARAEAGKAGLAFGRQLLPLVELESERSTIRLNGQPLFVSSAITSGPIGAILDRFERDCAGGSHAAETRFAPRLDVFRREAGSREGVVFCFAHGERSFADAALRYRSSRDLGEFGDLRYAYVTRTDDGRARVVATWTEGSFKLDAETETGDAAGSDPEEAPRPPHARRVLSATLGQAPGQASGPASGQTFGQARYGMYAFASSESPEAVARFYDRAMAERRWVAIRAPGTGPTERSWVKDGVQILVSASVDSSERTLVSIGELGAQAAQR
jgi:hypothetical protein